MKQFIIIPINQTEGMYGYSAIAIERCNDTLLNLQQTLRSLAGARAIDEDISCLIYNNPKLDIILLNEAFEPIVDEVHLVEFTEDNLNMFSQEGECKVNTPTLFVSTLQFEIEFLAEYSDSEINCEFTIEQILDLFK